MTVRVGLNLEYPECPCCLGSPAEKSRATINKEHFTEITYRRTNNASKLVNLTKSILKSNNFRKTRDLLCNKHSCGETVAGSHKKDTFTVSP